MSRERTAYMKAWRLAHPEYSKQHQRKYKTKRSRFLKTYKLATEQDWQHYLATDACECCGKTFGDGIVKNQHHDHDTGKLLGVWCWKCNHAEGNLDINSAYNIACSKAANTPLMELIKGLN